MSVKVTTTTEFTCDHCKEVKTEGIVFPGGHILIADSKPKAKPDGRGVFLCTTECASAWVESKLSK